MDIFQIKLLLAFIVGGIWITLITIVAEKFGTKLGGVAAGIPATSLIALFFIGWTLGPEFASETTNITPIIMGVNALFVITQILLSRFNFYLSLLASLLVWFILSLGLIFLNFNNFFYSILGFLVLFLISYHVLENKLKIKSKGRKIIHYNISQLLFRAILSGVIITFAVLMAKVGGPLFGGAFAFFPAVFTSTILITHFSHGRDFSSAVMKVALISGCINCVIYVIAVKYLYLSIGLWFGTLVSFIISLISSCIIYVFASKYMA